MNEAEERLRKLSKQIEDLMTGDLSKLKGKEHLIDELDSKTKDLELLYKRGE